MKKLLRILAILGSILLIGLYFITLILAILGKDFFPMFMAALFASMGAAHPALDLQLHL